MFTNNTAGRTSGIFSGFTSRWNPITRTVHALVKVGEDTIKVPIDHRQVKFIEKEYDIGSRVELRFYDGSWHVMSHIQPSYDMRLIESHQTFNCYRY